MASALAVGQGVAGAVMAVLPRRAARWSAVGGDAPPTWIVRLLGGRMVAQAAALEWVRRNRRQDEMTALKAGALVDFLHASSMVAAAALVPRYRRSALISAAMAFTAASGETTAASAGAGKAAIGTAEAPGAATTAGTTAGETAGTTAGAGETAGTLLGATSE